MHITSSEWVLIYMLILLAALFVFTALGHIFYQKRSPTSMMAWILSIIFVPFVAVPFYFLIGIRKRERKHQKEYVEFSVGDEEVRSPSSQEHTLFATLEKNGIPPASSGHDFSLISKNNEAFFVILDEINKAQYSIDICMYLFVMDETTKEIYDALVQRAQEGIKVRLLLDTVGSLDMYLSQKKMQRLIDAGGEVAYFTSLLKRPYLNYISLRNHRKMYIFDQQVVLSGGMNLSDEYIGTTHNEKRFIDLLYRLKGPRVAYFYHIFHQDWVYATKEEAKPTVPWRSDFDGDESVQVVPSGPDITSDALYETLLNVIYNVKERLWIVTPYFVPDEHIMRALIIAHRKGIDIKLITPKDSDHVFVDLVRMSYIRQLHKIGVDVRLYNDAILHAKAILVDNSAAMVGTVNMDNRSLFFNYEVVTFVYSSRSVLALEEWIESLLPNTHMQIEKPSKVREAFENIMKVFAPIL